MSISTDGDGHRALTLRADDFPQVDNIGMVQILQQLDLPDGSDWKALLLSVHADLLQGNLLPCPLVCCKVHLRMG